MALENSNPMSVCHVIFLCISTQRLIPRDR